MTFQITTHEVQRSARIEKNDQLLYECVDCGLMSHKVVVFDACRCDQDRHNPTEP